MNNSTKVPEGKGEIKTGSAKIPMGKAGLANGATGLPTGAGALTRKAPAIPLFRESLLLSTYTLLAFNLPFFLHATRQMEGGWNALLLTASAAGLMLGLNFLVAYLLLYLGRFVGKLLLALTMLGNAVMLYFVVNFDVLVTDSMMGNVLNTHASEATSFLSLALGGYVLLLGLPAALYILLRKTRYPTVRHCLRAVLLTLALVVLILLANLRNVLWIDQNATELGSLIAPWSYIVNTARYYNDLRENSEEEELLPDARGMTDSRDLLVLMIGESARRDHCAYYGYSRPTNPYTALDSLAALPAVAAATNTIDAVRAMMQPELSKTLLETLPNYLHRMGVAVSWRTSNWGEPPTHFPDYLTDGELQKRFPTAEDRDYDGLLLCDLEELIRQCTLPKQLIVIHTYTNHGPAYSNNYPPQFETFKPVCRTVEMARANRAELINAYDNSMIYTDYLIHKVIQLLRSLPDRRSCLLFMSDHGESLGENGLYMHGVPMALAPKEQVEIPFLVWTSDKTLRLKSQPVVEQYSIYHTALTFLGIDSPVLQPTRSIWE